MAAQFATMASMLQNLQLPTNVEPAIIHLPSPPKLEGALSPNSWLAKVQRHADKRLEGPKSLLVARNGHIFAGTADGYLVHVKPDGTVDKLRRFPSDRCGQQGQLPCGRPMGIRLDNLGLIVLADAYYGIYRINQYSGEAVHLVDTRTLQVNGRPVGFVNDLAVGKDGTLYFTSSSSRWPLSLQSNILLEAENTGRVLKYKEGKVSEVVTKLSFPTGLEMSPDGSYLLIGEGTFSRIWRAWVGDNAGVKRNVLEVFASNLPGVVDSVRGSPRGTYWVALSLARHSKMPSILDVKGHDRPARTTLISMVNRKVYLEPPRFGVVVELDSEGRVLRSLQDPAGTVYSGVSEVQETDRFIFFASTTKNFIGFLNVSELKEAPGTGGQSTHTTTSTPASANLTSNATTVTSAPAGNSLSLNSNPRFVALVSMVRQNMDKMTSPVLKQAVVDVVRELVYSRHQALVLRRMVEAREAIMRQLQQSLSLLHQQFWLQQQQLPANGTTSPTNVTLGLVSALTIPPSSRTTTTTTTATTTTSTATTTAAALLNLATSSNPTPRPTTSLPPATSSVSSTTTSAAGPTVADTTSVATTNPTPSSPVGSSSAVTAASSAAVGSAVTTTAAAAESPAVGSSTTVGSNTAVSSSTSVGSNTSVGHMTSTVASIAD